MHMRTVIFVCLAIALSGWSLVFAPPAQARGRLIKGSLPAVYYLGSDGDRYVFPNERIYFSWYPDFSSVDEVTDTQLAHYEIGGNVTYRPGTRLVKLTNDPKVYAVEPGGVLRWITSETVAKSLYGSDWAARVDDLSDGLFPAYSTGEDLEQARYPEGALLDVGGTYQVVWGGIAHELSDDAIEHNGIQTSFAIPVTDVSLSEGEAISSDEEYLYDTAQIGLGETLEQNVAGETSVFDTTIAQGTDDAVIGAFVISVREETVMRNPSVLFEARTNADSDADAGGLIRGDGDDQQIEANLQSLKIVDLGGTSLFGTKQLGTVDTGDGKQTLAFSGSLTLRPGRHAFYVLADIVDDAPSDEQYRVTLDLAETDWLVGGDAAESVDPETLALDTVTITKNSISISRDSSVESVFTLRSSTGPFDVAAFAFTNGLDADVHLTRLSLTAYVDANEGSTDFQIGSDGDTSGTVSAGEIIDSLSVVRASDGAVLDTVSSIGSDGIIEFDGMKWDLPQGETTLIVRVKTDADAPTGLESDRIAFDIVASEDVDIEALDGEGVDADADSPNGGSSPKTTLTIAASGSLSIDGSGDPEDVALMGADAVPFYELTLAASDEEDVVVDTLSFRYVDQDASRDVEDATLRVGSAEYDGAATVSGITFSHLSLTVPAGEEIDAEVLLDMASSSQGAVSGDMVGIAFEPSTLSAEGMVSGVEFSAADVGDTVTDETSEGSEAVVLRNLPVVVSLASDVETQQRDDDETELLRFTMGSSGEGTSKLKTITFKIQPNDEGESGSDNDLLERLADVNGDAQDDNDVATLTDETSNDDLGEGGDGHIDFSIYDRSANVLDTTPAGLDTASGDYGVVTIEFTTSQTLWSTPHEYAFFLRTIGIVGQYPKVSATLLGGSDFVWNDGSTSTLSQDGDGVDGLPVSGPTVSIE